MLTLLIVTPLTYAGFLDFVKDIDISKLTDPTQTAIPTSFSNDDIISDLKEALAKGTTFAVENLSANGGFMDHADVKVPIPESIQPIASSLNMLGQADLVNSFQATLNSAAEQAAPEAAAIFSNTIQQMSIDDAANILNGPDNAATEYFK